MIVKGLTTSGQFFVCPVYNELILAGKKITTHHLPDGAMHSLGTPEDVELFLKEFGTQRSKPARANMSVLQIVVPMAGRGSRFASAGYTTPKPLIPVGGRPMIQWVIENIRPRRAHQFTFICLAEHLEKYPEVPAELRRICPGCDIIPVRAVTEGAACTVLLAKDLINSDDPLMIANSDQIVDLDINDYLAAGDAPDVDGLIMTFWSDHPKWSYCRLRPDKR